MSTTGTTENPWAKWQESILTEGLANARRLAQFPSLYERAKRVQKGATPSEVVYEEDRLKLLHYPCKGPVRHCKLPRQWHISKVEERAVFDLVIFWR